MQLKQFNLDNKMQIVQLLKNVTYGYLVLSLFYYCSLTHQSHKRENFTLIASFM